MTILLKNIAPDEIIRGGMYDGLPAKIAAAIHECDERANDLRFEIADILKMFIEAGLSDEYFINKMDNFWSGAWVNIGAALRSIHSPDNERVGDKIRKDNPEIKRLNAEVEQLRSVLRSNIEDKLGVKL
jgi:hypothetical protein